MHRDDKRKLWNVFLRNLTDLESLKNDSKFKHVSNFRFYSKLKIATGSASVFSSHVKE